MFYFYYNPMLYQSGCYKVQEVVREFVRRAGLHTYVIEPLAKSAMYEESLSGYLQKIKEIGFQFPSLAVTTRRHSGSATVNNIIFTLVELAKLITNAPKRIDEMRMLTDEAIRIKSNIDAEHAGYFSNDIEDSLIWLLSIT